MLDIVNTFTGIEASSVLDLIVQKHVDELVKQTKFPCAVGEYARSQYRAALESQISTVIYETYPDLAKKALSGGRVTIIIRNPEEDKT